ncbi:hypothetical protein PMI16_01875 [Herbaspirillum sp. CF444]|uniref:hypothetical protein n=1 Tax=Herbaspirillum sp. CF444 TaxID=1144319 RepID=UPI0002723FFF|nr:hypothetical protein [Herbaspirillum sp. CF444]EJL90068.1 hypothetical protein PMI16_01875 [Herbaspirillum sp. CF444]
MKISSSFFWQLRRFFQALGWPGSVGMLVLGIGIASYFLVLIPLRQDVSSLKADAQELRRKSKLRSTEIKALNPAEQLADFYRFFPEQDTVPDGMDRIYAAASMQGVVLERGDYQLAGERDSKLLRYDLVFPVKGGYLQIRKFIAQVLNEVPNASLDSVVFTRQRINDPMIDAQLKFALYLRPLQ